MFYRTIKLICIVTVLYSVNVHAGMYKCKDADGGITYSQSACPKNQKVDKVIKVETNLDFESTDCKYASKFATSTAKSMKSGVQSNEIFNQYGGIDSLSKGTINLINYVYKYQLSVDVSAERIAALSQTKCQAHSFGDVGCEDLPLSFTDRLGGCGFKGNEPLNEKKLVEEQPTKKELEQAQKDGEKARILALQKAEEANQKREAQEKARIIENSRKCKERYETIIDQLDARMRKGYSSEQGEVLRENRRGLKKQMAEC